MTPEQNRLIAVLSASNFAIGMGAFVVIGVLTPLAESLRVTPQSAGQVMTVYALSYAVLSPVLVSLTGRLGRRRVLAYSFGIFILAAALSAVAPSLWALNAARVIAAAGAGVFTPVAAAVAAALSPPETRARTLAAVFFGLTLAQVAGVPLGSALAYSLGWRWAFAAVVAIGLPCIWLIWRSVPAGLRFQPVSLGDLGRVLRAPSLMIAVLFTASFLSGIYVIFTYITPLLEDRMGFGGTMVTLALTVAGLGAVAGNVMGGVLSDRLGPARTLIFLACAQVVLLGSFVALPLPTPVVFAQIFLWNLCGWSFMAGQQTRLIALNPSGATVLLALNAASIYVGAAIGSAIGGAALGVVGLGGLGYVAAAVAAFALLHILISTRLSRP